MNIIEFFNKSYSLKGEVLLNGEKKNKFCLTIVQTDGSRKATKTVQFYLSLTEGQVLFQDFVSGSFWTDDRRYPEGKFRRTKSSGEYRDFLVTREGMFSIINGKENVLRFNLDPFQMAELGTAMIEYLRLKRLAWALSAAQNKG